MDNTLSKIGSFLAKYFPPWVIILLIFIVVIVFFIDKIQILVSCIWQVFEKFWPYARKKYTTNKIEGEINSFVKTKVRDITDEKEKKVKVQWVKKVDKDFFSDGDSFVICMQDNVDTDEVIVDAVAIYTSRHILCKTKLYLSANQAKALDLAIVKEILSGYRNRARYKFVEKYLKPGLENSKVNEHFEDFCDMSRKGLFSTIALPQLIFVGEKEYSPKMKYAIQEDITRFLQYLKEFSEREVGSASVENIFAGKVSMCSIVVIGKKDKIFTEGISPYQKFLKKLAGEGIETMFLLCGLRNKGFMLNQVCSGEFLESINYEIVRKRVFKQIIKCDGEERSINSFVVVLQRKNIPEYIKE